MLLDSDGLSEVSGLVYVAASADGYVVGEELEGDYFQDGEQELVGWGGTWITCSTSGRCGSCLLGYPALGGGCAG